MIILSQFFLLINNRLKQIKTQKCLLVEEDGFEPSKAELTDLQSAPFGHSGIPPKMVLAVGIEPTTY